MRIGVLSSARQQRGMSLVVVLVLLVVLTLLALAGIRGTLLEQFMSTSQIDRNWTFQATEAALREAEAVAATKPAAPGGACTNGICDPPAAGVRRWLDANGNGVPNEAADEVAWIAISREATVALGTATAKPRYIIEVMQVDAIPGANCVTDGDVSPDAACTSRESRYRVTARTGVSDLASGRSEVILQSNLAVP